MQVQQRKKEHKPKINFNKVRLAKNNDPKNNFINVEESKGSLLSSNISPLKVYKKAAPLSSVSTEQFMIVNDAKGTANHSKKKKNPAAVLSQQTRSHQINPQQPYVNTTTKQLRDLTSVSSLHG